MKKIIKISLIILVLLAIVLIVGFYIFPITIECKQNSATTGFVESVQSFLCISLQEKKPKDRPQVFELKIGEKDLYKGEHNIEIELVEIGKIRDLINSPGFSLNDNPWIPTGPCKKEDCSDILELTYYALKVKTLKKSSCKETKIIFTNEGFYDCPSYYSFKLDPLNSNDNKIKFTVEYHPVVPL